MWLGFPSVVVLGLGPWPWAVLEDKSWVLGLEGQVLGLEGKSLVLAVRSLASRPCDLSDLYCYSCNDVNHIHLQLNNPTLQTNDWTTSPSIRYNLSQSLPFAEATDLTRGQKMVTISCVVPILLSLNNMPESFLQNSSVYTSFIQSLLTSLRDRFSSVYSLLGFMPLSSSSRSKSTSFSSTSNCNLFLMAAAMDPAFAFHWLQDLPGDSKQKEALRNKITGE